MNRELNRCWGDVSPLMAAYHDEWGVPCHDDRKLFEMLVLEGFQAGLSWETVLKKRENFRRAFDGWDVERIAGYGPREVERLLGDAGIIRNRAKVEAAVKNAQAALAVAAEFGTFDRYLWSIVGGGPLKRAAPKSWSEVPAVSPEATAMSKELKNRGFGFVGPTICYAFMQAVGMVNDHLAGCTLATESRAPERLSNP